MIFEMTITITQSEYRRLVADQCFLNSLVAMAEADGWINKAFLSVIKDTRTADQAAHNAVATVKAGPESEGANAE